MQRIHAPFDESTLEQIDREVKKKGVSRAQWLSSSVSSYLCLVERTKGVDPAEVAQEWEQLRSTNENLWRENQKLKKAVESASEELAQNRRKINALEEQITSAMQETEKLRMNMILLKHDETHFQDTVRQKDQQVAFLEAHIAQLTQSISQLSLPPNKEEAQRKGWSWKFWR
jgi:chromosome segregation ATPase